MQNYDGNKWHPRFTEMAKLIASWSRDPRTKVGCVIVRPDKTIASVGFNGFPRGFADRPELLGDRDFKHKIVIHAEENALLHCYHPVRGCTAYIWPVPPCSRCAAKLVQVGIAKVVCPVAPPTDPDSKMEYMLALSVLSQGGVEVEYV